MEAYVSLTCCCIFLFNYVLPILLHFFHFFILDMFSLATVKNSEKEAIQWSHFYISFSVIVILVCSSIPTQRQV